MKSKFINVYGFIAIFLLAVAVIWFGISVTAETRKGVIEAERSFNWISREGSATAIADGFMSDAFIQKMTGMCNDSKHLAALVITTPSGTAFAWPDRSPAITYDIDGRPSIANTSLFMKVYAMKFDIGGTGDGTIVMTAAMYVLHPDAIFAASRNAFLAILTILLATFVVILLSSSYRRSPTTVAASDTKHAERLADLESGNSPSTEAFADEEEFIPPMIPECLEDRVVDVEASGALGDSQTVDYDEGSAEPPEAPVAESVRGDDSIKPEGLFSPVTGIGWEQYLSERLESELVRAASSEQDLSLVILRISGLLHTDLISRKVATILLDTFKFKDMVFEFGSNGFAGILQNVNLDQAMKIADTLYAGIDSLLMEMSHEGQITVGITTRTARLLPASRMIEEAMSAARKAEEEPSLPIVAFRANPEKYRDYVAEKA